MAKQFNMGARMTLKDQFKSTVSRITKGTMEFKKSVDSANSSVTTYTDKMGRLRDEHGKFISTGNKASVMTRTWIGANGKLSSSFSFVARGIQAAVAAFGLMKAKNWLVDANADMETYKNTLTVVLKSEKKAVETLAWATKFAAQTPFEIPQIVEATTRMTAYGINAQKTLGIVGDMASVMGKDLMQAVEAVADAQTGELERLKEFGITKKMLIAEAKLRKVQIVNSKGAITDQKAFNATLFSLMEKRFKGGMAMQSKTFKGMLSNAKDFVGGVGRTLGAPIFEEAKKGLSGMLDFMNQLQSSGAIDRMAGRVKSLVSVFSKGFGFAKSVVVDMVKVIGVRMGVWYYQNKTRIMQIGTAFAKAFKALKTAALPIINWLKDTAFPGLLTVIGAVGTMILNVAGWFTTNWSTVGPLIYGIATAWGVYFTVTKGIMLATKAWTAVQAGLNIVMNANPIGLIITGIGLLIGAIILVVKNWDKVKGALINGAKAVGTFFSNTWGKMKGAASNAWDTVKTKASTTWSNMKAAGQYGGMLLINHFMKVKQNYVDAFNMIKRVGVAAWEGLKNGAKVAWGAIIGIAKAPINFIISGWNLIFRAINKIGSIKAPDWIPGIGGKSFGFHIPEIPYLAKGTKNWQGGPAFMNERGGELAVLPGGSQVIPADKTDKILDKPKSGTTIQNLIGKLEIHQQPGEDAESLAYRVIELLHEKLTTADEIANTGEMGVLV